MKRLLVFLIAAFVWSAACRGEAASPADGPYYGVCRHLYGDSLAEKKLPLMRAAGIRCARADFRWGSIEPKPGQWDFSHADRLVEL
ncbi:MAG: beta-galactosidase, partial [Thermoguttaceae bacterium]|nr:beta-galactosidase [Thermoguttaceae bacterium]